MSLGRLGRAGQNLQQCALTGAVSANDSHRLARRHLEADVAQRPARFVTNGTSATHPLRPTPPAVRVAPVTLAELFDCNHGRADTLYRVGVVRDGGGNGLFLPQRTPRGAEGGEGGGGPARPAPARGRARNDSHRSRPGRPNASASALLCVLGVL